MGILNPEDASDNVKRMAEQYREKIIGKTALQSAPQEYWDIGMVIEMRIPLSVWKAMPIDDRAKILAQHYLHNMIQVIDAHYKEQDEIMKKNNKRPDDG
jgi:intergrase/recombinase